MSLLRHPIYVWGDGKRWHLWVREDGSGRMMNPDWYEGFDGGISMPEAVFDAIVLYRAAQLIEDTKDMRRAVKKAKKLAGNFGSFRFLELLGEDPEAEFARRIDEAKAARKGDR